jgi:hypothetical protein
VSTNVTVVKTRLEILIPMLGILTRYMVVKKMECTENLTLQRTLQYELKYAGMWFYK